MKPPFLWSWPMHYIVDNISGTSKYHNVHKPSENVVYEIPSCVESEQTYLVSRSLIPVPLLLCIAFHAVLFKRTSYLEGGRVICESKIRRNNHIVIDCGKHISSPRCE